MTCCSLLHECLEMITVMEDAPLHIFEWDLGGRGQESELELKKKCFLGMPFTELLLDCEYDLSGQVVIFK